VQLNALFSCLWRITLRLLVINISSSSPAINTADYYQRCVTTCETVAVVHRRLRLQHLACCTVNTGSQARLQAQNRDFCLSHLHSMPPLGGSRQTIAIPFGAEILEWRGYLMVKIFRRYLYSF